MVEVITLLVPPISLRIGDVLKNFSLKGVDGKTYSFKDFSSRKVLVVIFISNNSKYSRAYEQRIVKMQNNLEEYSVQFMAINSNDSTYSLHDGYYKLVEQARKNGFNFPYIKDYDQSLAKYFDVICTPEAFVFDQDRTLIYRGQIDDNWSNPKAVKINYVVKAVHQVLKNRLIQINETAPLGDSIKWTY